jgi:transposase
MPVERAIGCSPGRSKPLPDWGHVHAELRRRGVTLALLWEEYRGHHPDDGYGYSRFCDLYVEWRHGITATMRQTHAAVGIVTRPPTQAASILRESIGYSGTPSTTKLRNFASLSRSGRRSLKAVELR